MNNLIVKTFIKIKLKSIRITQLMLAKLLLVIKPHDSPLWVYAAFYKLDKLSSLGYHNYISVYSNLFENRRRYVTGILEIGIGVVENGQMLHTTGQGYKTGNSLRCWRDYFSGANVVGLDLYPTEIREPRISTFQVDQSNKKSLKEFMEICSSSFDIIIDDGSHEYAHQVLTFEVLNCILSENGIYIIEDVSLASCEKFKMMIDFSDAAKKIITENYTMKIICGRKDVGDGIIILRNVKGDI